MSTSDRLDVTEWSFYNPVRVRSGVGYSRRLGADAVGCRHALVVTFEGDVGRSFAGRMTQALREGSSTVSRVSVIDDVSPNPTLAQLREQTKRFRESGVDLIVGIGGGSVLDTAKTLGVTLATSDESWVDALRSGRSQTWTRRLPVIAIPTTSGTGAEVTPFATVWDSELMRKYSVMGPEVFPTVAVIDPELTLSLPPGETFYTGMDALSHALESLWNKNRTPVSVSVATRSLRLVVEALPALMGWDDLRVGESRLEPAIEARARMAWASTLAGLAISNTKTAIAHALSYPMTLHFGVPHGIACSFTLPRLLDWNRDLVERVCGDADLIRRVEALLRRARLDKAMARYVTLDSVRSVEGDMLNMDRLGNFDGRLEGAPFDVVTRSLSGSRSE